MRPLLHTYSPSSTTTLRKACFTLGWVVAAIVFAIIGYHVTVWG